MPSALNNCMALISARPFTCGGDFRYIGNLYDVNLRSSLASRATTAVSLFGCMRSMSGPILYVLVSQPDPTSLQATVDAA